MCVGGGGGGGGGTGRLVDTGGLLLYKNGETFYK